MCVCVRSPSFQSNTVLYITLINNASLLELVMQGLEEKLEKSCFQCKRNTWHKCSQHILHSPKYLIINIKPFSYAGNQFIRNIYIAPLGLDFMLGTYTFSQQATIDHHRFFMYSGHYTAAVYCCEKTFIAITTKLMYLIYIIPEDWPWCGHILFISQNTGRRIVTEPVRWTICFLLMTSGLVLILDELYGYK